MFLLFLLFKHVLDRGEHGSGSSASPIRTKPVQTGYSSFFVFGSNPNQPVVDPQRFGLVHGFPFSNLRTRGTKSMMWHLIKKIETGPSTTRASCAFFYCWAHSSHCNTHTRSPLLSSANTLSPLLFSHIESSLSVITHTARRRNGLRVWQQPRVFDSHRERRQRHRLPLVRNTGSDHHFVAT